MMREGPWGKTPGVIRWERAQSGEFHPAIAAAGTENDAARLARSGAPVKQITTGTVSHLDAGMVELFIENVGDLVCPSSFDVGEELRLVLTSTTEGEDKPLKYPTIFNTADVAVITKLDMAEAAGCDLDAVRRNIHAVRPGMEIFAVSAKTGAGMDALSAFLVSRHAQAQVSQAV